MAKKFPMKWVAIGIVLIVVLGIVGWLVGTYNGFIAKEQDYMSKWSEVENQYQRQADLIPNLVTTLKNYQQFEQETFTAITELRSQWSSANTIAEKDTVGQEMNSALGRLIVTVENYPELKTIEAVNNLMDELAGTQNRISVARMRFIESVQKYNTAIKIFPASVLANAFGFEQVDYFEAKEGVDSGITIDL